MSRKSDPQTNVRTALIDGLASALSDDVLRALAAALEPYRPTPGSDLVLRSKLPDPAAVRRAINRGELPASKVGRDHWIKQADLDAYIESHRVAPKLRKATAPTKRSPEETLQALLPGRVVVKKPA